MKPLLKLKSPTLQYINVVLTNPHQAVIPEGTTVVIGANGAGKSTLGRIIEKGWNITTNSIEFSPSRQKPRVKYVEFNDIHSLSGFHLEYYQQRHEATMNDEVPTVQEILGDKAQSQEWLQLSRLLNLHEILDKKVNFLSSGELRKLLIITTLFDRPDVLVIDNPYIGLDAASRELFNDMLHTLVDSGVSLVMLLCNPNEIPSFTDAMIPMRNLEIGSPVPSDGDPAKLRNKAQSLMDFAVDLSRIPRPSAPRRSHDITLRLNGCNVRYGTREIIRGESWTVKEGECWALAGPNGCGKSVLLSLVYADNPQAYSNDITIFDKRRGSGESIWDIKSRIGYVSPEMHLYFKHHGTVEDVIAQGVKSAVGNYGNVSGAAREEARQWMQLLHIEPIAQRRYTTLSTGEQRLVLIARTLIKHPDLLIFDEPLHGLDAARKKSVKAIIDSIAHRDRPTIIYVTHYLPEVPECVRFTKTLQKLKNA